MRPLTVPKRLIKRCAQLTYYLYASVMIPLLYAYAHRLGELRYLSDEDHRIWKQAMKHMLKEHVRSGYSSRLNELIPEFATVKIHAVRITDSFISSKPTVVLCVKNDKRRIRMLVEHYRKLGICQFAFLDNGSTDGTLEWLLEQPDIDIYSTSNRYSSFRKEAWINRIVSYYGFERWFLLTDSDELVVYIGMESHPFNSVLKYAEKHNISRIKGLTLDMYANGAIFSGGNDADIQSKYCWSDSDSFLEEERVIGNSKLSFFTGGPRYRAMNVKTSLSKYPLIYFTKGMISENAHFQYPYQPAVDAPCYFGILHYKFLDEDKKTYRERGDKMSGFARGGDDYRRYMSMAECDSEASFIYEGSVKYTDSSCLQKMPWIEAIHFTGERDAQQ